MSVVVGVALCISVLVTAVVLTYVALAVVVRINVSSLLGRIGVTVAGNCEPVMSLVIGVFVSVFVAAEYVGAGLGVALSVVVRILVLAFYLCIALIAYKVLVGILVLRTFYVTSARIALEVTVVVNAGLA